MGMERVREGIAGAECTRARAGRRQGRERLQESPGDGKQCSHLGPAPKDPDPRGGVRGRQTAQVILMGRPRFEPEL